MIARLKGEVVAKKFNYLILDVHGVGYQVYMNTDRIKLNDMIVIHTHLQIKEDGHLLYGFLDEKDLLLFQQLISVKGIGCKTAIGFFQMYNAQSIASAIEKKDKVFLKKLPSVGEKAASQIILDLHGKIDFSEHNTNSVLAEALEALSSLGYGSVEIRKMEKLLAEWEFESSDEYIKKALQLIAKGG